MRARSVQVADHRPRLDRQSERRNLRRQEEPAMANTQAITDLLQRATDAGDMPGVVVAAATAGGTIFAGGAGVRDTTSGTPMTAETVVWIASMTKAVTGACAMQLVEQG